MSRTPHRSVLLGLALGISCLLPSCGTGLDTLDSGQTCVVAVSSHSTWTAAQLAPIASLPIHYVMVGGGGGASGVNGNNPGANGVQLSGTFTIGADSTLDVYVGGGGGAGGGWGGGGGSGYFGGGGGSNNGSSSGGGGGSSAILVNGTPCQDMTTNALCVAAGGNGGGNSHSGPGLNGGRGGSTNGGLGDGQSGCAGCSGPGTNGQSLRGGDGPSPCGSTEGGWGGIGGPTTGVATSVNDKCGGGGGGYGGGGGGGDNSNGGFGGSNGADGNDTPTGPDSNGQYGVPGLGANDWLPWTSPSSLPPKAGMGGSYAGASSANNSEGSSGGGNAGFVVLSYTYPSLPPCPIGAAAH